eukprot:403373073
MDRYGRQEESFSEYFNSAFSWLILFSVLAGLALTTLLVSGFCVTCPQCCTNCKKDLKRSDYRKSEKVWPFILFLLCSLLSMVLASYGIYLVVQIKDYYYQSRCTSASFVEDLNNGTGNVWGGFQRITNKLNTLDTYIQQEQAKIKEVYIDKNQSWILEQSKQLDLTYQNLSKTYTNYAVADFNLGRSVLQVLSSGVIGPIENNNTRLGQVLQEKNDNFGSKLENLRLIYNQSMKVHNSSFRAPVQQAVSTTVVIDQSAQYLYSQVPSMLDDVHPYALAALITMIGAFCIAILSMILSNVSFSLVVCTQQRKFKNLSNLGWVSSSISLLIIYVVCCFLSISGFVAMDFCKIVETSYTQEKMTSYPRFMQKPLGNAMYECFYGQSKSVKTAFGIQTQLDTLTTLQKQIIMFNPSSRVSNNNTRITSLIADMQANYTNPGQLKFSDTSKRQPSEQILLINQATNQNQQGALIVCDSAQDMYIEGPCTATGYYILKTSDNPTQNRGLKTCIDITKFSFQFISQRYSNQQGCEDAKSRYSQYRQYYQETAATDPPPGGILRQLMNDLSTMFSTYSQIRTNITNINTSVGEQKTILDNALENQDPTKSFDQNLDCSELYASYVKFKEPLCSAVLPGIVEVLVISCFIGVFNLMCTIFGVCFVLRNKVDVPQRKNSKNKSKYEKISSQSFQSDKKGMALLPSSTSKTYYNKLQEEEVSPGSNNENSKRTEDLNHSSTSAKNNYSKAKGKRKGGNRNQNVSNRDINETLNQSHNQSSSYENPGVINN